MAIGGIGAGGGVSAIQLSHLLNDINNLLESDMGEQLPNILKTALKNLVAVLTDILSDGKVSPNELKNLKEALQGLKQAPASVENALADITPEALDQMIQEIDRLLNEEDAFQAISPFEKIDVTQFEQFAEQLDQLAQSIPKVFETLINPMLHNFNQAFSGLVPSGPDADVSNDNRVAPIG